MYNVYLETYFDQYMAISDILLAQIKSGNNSYKLKNEMRQILHLLHKHNNISKKV